MFFKTAFILLFFAVLLIFFARPTFAALFINEFSSDSADSDWVEIYNNGSDSIDLSFYRLRDNTVTNKLDLSGMIAPQSFIVFEWSNRLNKDGDLIKLLIAADESIVDQVGYGDVGNDIIAPSFGQSAGRQNDGGASWVIFDSHTKGSSNNTADPVPTATPTFTPTPTPTTTPTRTPTPTKIPTPTKSPTPVNTPTSTSAPFAPVVSIKSPTPIQKLTIVSISPKLTLGKDTTVAASPKILGKQIEKSGGNYLSRILISIGLVLLISCGILFARSYIKNRKQKDVLL